MTRLVDKSRILPSDSIRTIHGPDRGLILSEPFTDTFFISSPGLARKHL
jgi:hypothetical protein